MRGGRQDQHWCVYENHGGEWGKCGRVEAEDIRGKHYVWQGGHYIWQGGHYIWQGGHYIWQGEEGGKCSRVGAMGESGVSVVGYRLRTSGVNIMYGRGDIICGREDIIYSREYHYI